MRKIICFLSTFFVCALFEISFAQTYSVKIFPNVCNLGIYDKEISEKNPTIEISEEEKKEFLKTESDFFEIHTKAGSELKIKESKKSFSQDYFTRENWKKKFLINPKKDGSVGFSYKSSKTIQQENRHDKKSFFHELESIEVSDKTVRIGVLTVVYLKVNIVEVRDQIPILGDLPLIGFLWQSKGEARQIFSCCVLITELEEDNTSKETE